MGQPRSHPDLEISDRRAHGIETAITFCMVIELDESKYHGVEDVVLSICVFVCLWVCYHDNSKLRALLQPARSVCVSTVDHVLYPSCQYRLLSVPAADIRCRR